MKPCKPLWLALLLAVTPALHAEEAAEPAEIAIGERLFLETRFAQPYAAAPASAGAAISCRSCHLVDEQADSHGMRTYADFARRPAVPPREDGQRVAVRNSQSLVASAIVREGRLMLHYDGEFASLEALVTGTLTGRNYGWLPGEAERAVRHIATVIRDDDGSGALAQEFGGSYRRVLAGAAELPAGLRLPAGYRVDVERAPDTEIVAAVARLIAAYVADLDFSRDAQGLHDGSPYDAFLAKNGLERAPRAGEDGAAYARRLLAELQSLEKPVFVTATDGRFETHEQAFVFGENALAGLKLFLDPESGNCAACHTPPAFTDFGLHNTGASQLAYDALHGQGAFAVLAVPDAAGRVADDLPPSERYPGAGNRFRAVPVRERPGRTDLGAWNTVLNPDLPDSQTALRKHLCPAGACTDDALLDRAFAAFKTPTVRDLGHSGPYLHDGSRDSVADMLAFYVTVGELARAGRLRHGDEELAKIRLAAGQAEQLAAFLRALNEDYD